LGIGHKRLPSHHRTPRSSRTRGVSGYDGIVTTGLGDGNRNLKSRDEKPQTQR